jgi:superfamily II DNA or RNA helicase
MQPLRDYQDRAIRGVCRSWESGKRRVLLCSPTGSGKTRMGEELVTLELQRGGRVLWVCHRIELVRQAADRLRAAGMHVGIVGPGEPWEPDAPVQVATIQSLAARGLFPAATLFVWDEAHHANAEEWAKVAGHYSGVRHAGLTATPERQDGKPLGDMFDDLVVAAQYSELLAAGHLVQCKVFQPPEIFGNGLAQDPLVALQRYAPEGSRGFVFNASVALANETAEKFTAAGIATQPISFKTPGWQRAMFLEQFAQKKLAYLTNQNVLTEGVDVPDAQVCMLASACSHVSGFLQKVGRVLRPSKDKPHAIVIDLSGATLIHGMPTEDRIYSLEGKGIKRTSVAPMKSCPKCGATILAAYPVCPECSYEFPKKARSGPRIYDLALVEVYAGAETPEDAKRREYKRLRALQKSRGFSLYFVVKSYRDLFGEAPTIDDATDAERHEELKRLNALAASKGFKAGFAKVRYKQLFGQWPARGF